MAAIARLGDVDLDARPGDVDPDAHAAQRAWSMVQLGKILVGLGSVQDATAPLHEALDIYQHLPSPRRKRDSDAMADAQDLLDSFG